MPDPRGLRQEAAAAVSLYSVMSMVTASPSSSSFFQTSVVYCLFSPNTFKVETQRILST